MNSNNGKTAILINKYGEKEILHSTRRGWTRRQRNTTILSLSRPIGRLIGQRIKSLRLKRGYTLAELCLRADISAANPKSRMWEIENCVRNEAVRIGTLYAFAIALGVPVTDLLPSVAEVKEICEIKMQTSFKLNADSLINELSKEK